MSTDIGFMIRIVVFDSWQISTSSQNGLNKSISSTVLHCVPHEMVNPCKENTETITTTVHALCHWLFQYNKPTMPPGSCSDCSSQPALYLSQSATARSSVTIYLVIYEGPYLQVSCPCDPESGVPSLFPSLLLYILLLLLKFQLQV